MTFGIKFLVTVSDEIGDLEEPTFDSSIYIYISFTLDVTTCLANVEVWYVKRCRRSMSKGDRVTFLGCCEGTIDDFDKDGAPVCFGVWHILVGHIGHTPFTLITQCKECSQVFDLPGLWSLRCMLCIAMCIYVTESQVVFQLLFSSNSVDSDNFVHFLVHSNPTHEFLADNLMVTKHCGGTDVWCRSYLAACLGPRPIQYNPRNHWYVSIYCRLFISFIYIYMYIFEYTYT